MNPAKQSCDLQRIHDYLDERLGDAARAEFEDHLTGCDGCQSELQRHAAEPEMWRDAVQLLRDVGEVSGPADDGEDGRQRRKVLSVLDSLAPTDDPEMLGRIGDYEISGVVGTGGMGAVLKGFDRSLRRVVAIKVMAPHLAGSGPARTRFQREARAAAAITHDNVIDTYGVSEANGLPYLVMPFARGPSLQRRIDDSGPLTAIEVVRIGRQIASGLAAAHEQGLVHRDIKPANILLNEGIERLWITDFGVARAMDDASMTQTGLIAGTPQYMSPEQARGDSVDHRSDLFSLGSILYTACTGRAPFRSEAAWGILRRITDTDPTPIREINPDVPEWLCRIIERLMAKHPADRHQSAEDVAELFENCLAHLQQPTQVELPQSVAVVKPADTTVLSQRMRQTKSGRVAAVLRRVRFQPAGVRIMIGVLLLSGMGFAVLQLTDPADISGHWSGEIWKKVSLSSVDEATGWYTGAFTDAQDRRGALQLEWSRLQRRYNGRWKVGDEHSGTVTLRVRGDGVRGAVMVDPASPVAPDMPRLREFSWQRPPVGSVNASKPPDAEKQTGLPTPIQTPVKGRVVRWGDGIHENARVSKGDFIAELADLDPDDHHRLEEQFSAAEDGVEAAQALVRASEINLESVKTSVTSLESQLRTYQQVKSQIAAAAEASVESARNKVNAEKAELAECEATLEQAQADFERQKQLFDKRIIPELKFQEAKRKFKEAAAKVTKAEAYVQAAKSDVIARQNDEKARETKAQIDIDFATAAVDKARGDVARAESELAKASLELHKAENDVSELQTRQARQTHQHVVAPFSGVVTKLTRNTVLKEGDTICLIWPAAADTQAEVKVDDSASTNAAPAGIAVTGLAGTSAWRITETLGAASALGRRFREIRTKLRTADKNGASQASVARLREDLASAEFERETAVAILTAQLDAAGKLNESQATLRDRVKLQVETGDLDPYSLPQAEQAVVTTSAEIRQLELLLDYYTNLAKEKPTSPDDERSIALDVLKVRLEAASNRLRFQADLSKLTRQRFEVGDLDVQDLLKAGQAEATVAAEVQKLEALLRYFEKLGMNDAEAGTNSPSAVVNGDTLKHPQSDKEQRAIVRILSAQRDAAQAKLEQAQAGFEWQRRLFAEKLASSSALEAAKAAVAESQAAVAELDARLEYYKTPVTGNDRDSD